MKITDWAVIIVLIVGPLLWIGGWNTEQLRETNRLQIQYNTALRTAVQDAGSALNLNELQIYESGYGSEKYMRADKEAALAALLQTLALNLGIADDPMARQALMLYIPAVVVIDYDGYEVYAMEELIGEDGTPLREHRWHPKKPYLYQDDQGNSLSFTLDQRVTLIDTVTGERFSGLRKEIGPTSSVPLLHNADLFEQVRRSVIVRSIEEDLAAAINRHNEAARKLGVTYTFTLPVISQEEWNNTINDVGVLAFLQGIPVGNQFYNNYGLGGGRLVKNEPVYGGKEPGTGIKYASGAGVCPFPFPAEEVFTSARDAAAAGYFEVVCKQGAP